MKIIIKDVNNFYDNKIALVKDIADVAGIVVYWVSVGNVEFAVRSENAIKV